jgi:rSAM/selenodomain-associated transferase 2
MRFSVVIPTFNEERYLGACLEHVRRADHSVEIIVVDGGSVDRTVEIARSSSAMVLFSKEGRGRQQNAGAQAATGDILFFLHADTLIPSNAFDLVRGAFEDPNIQIGAFRMVFDHIHPLLSFYSFFTRFETPFSTFGDQCIVVRKSFFGYLGGFSEWPSFEDVRLLSLARRRTKVRKFPGTVITSARRFLVNGILRQQVWNAYLMARYFLGGSPDSITREYVRNGLRTEEIAVGSERAALNDSA